MDPFLFTLAKLVVAHRWEGENFYMLNSTKNQTLGFPLILIKKRAIDLIHTKTRTVLGEPFKYTGFRTGLRLPNFCRTIEIYTVVSKTKFLVDKYSRTLYEKLYFSF